MSYTNYSDLQASVAGYLGRSDLTTQIPDFIRFAEIRLGRELRTRLMLNSATAPTIANDAKVALPTDFLEIRDLFIQGNPRRPLSYMSPSAFSREAKADVIGLPVFYTLLASEFQFAPVPDAIYTLEVLYYAKPTFLSTANTSNVFLANYPDALLYASLIEAEPYLINDARSQLWSTLYDRAIKNITEANESSEFSGIPLQMKVT
tara:strand:+ start:54 stop:668 length:615 start_codon:yes stop_codon:yes gene_type:complete